MLSSTHSYFLNLEIANFSVQFAISEMIQEISQVLPRAFEDICNEHKTESVVVLEEEAAIPTPPVVPRLKLPASTASTGFFSLRDNASAEAASSEPQKPYFNAPK